MSRRQRGRPKRSRRRRRYKQSSGRGGRGLVLEFSTGQRERGEARLGRRFRDGVDSRVDSGSLMFRDRVRMERRRRRRGGGNLLLWTDRK